MDRKGKQKVRIICLILGVVILFVMIFFYKALYENRLCEKQKKELSVIYPEAAGELSENISYYADKNIKAVFYYVGGGMREAGQKIADTFHSFA